MAEHTVAYPEPKSRSLDVRQSQLAGIGWKRPLRHIPLLESGRMLLPVGTQHHAEEIGIGLQYRRPVEHGRHQRPGSRRANAPHSRIDRHRVMPEIKRHRRAVVILRLHRHKGQRRLISGHFGPDSILEAHHHRHRKHHHRQGKRHSGHSHDKARPRRTAAATGYPQPPAYHQ